MNIILGCAFIGVIVLSVIGIVVLELLYPFDKETDEEWLDRQW